jgi:hypothetical protein
MRRFLAVALVLVGAVLFAVPANAARCTGPGCYRYWADVSISAAWTTPSAIPVLPGSPHSYTARVTNTPWRTGGSSGPVSWPTGPASGSVFVTFEPGIPYSEDLYSIRVDSGPWAGGGLANNGGVYWDPGSIPPNTTFQVTASFFAPPAPGTYTLRIWLNAYQGGDPWTDYNPNNNEVFLTFQVGYLA